jgi:hypothetical protein
MSIPESSEGVGRLVVPSEDVMKFKTFKLLLSFLTSWQYAAMQESWQFDSPSEDVMKYMLQCSRVTGVGGSCVSVHSTMKSTNVWDLIVVCRTYIM